MQGISNTRLKPDCTSLSICFILYLKAKSGNFPCLERQGSLLLGIVSCTNIGLPLTASFIES